MPSIGFARRFATYKRTTMLVTDLDRLARLCGAPSTPVQFIFAGKAHPRDDDGTRLIQQVVELSHDARFAGRIAFVEDYDMNIGRHLVQAVDVWLNTPLRPLQFQTITRSAAYARAPDTRSCIQTQPTSRRRTTRKAG